MNRSWVRFPQAAQRFTGKPANSQAKNSPTPYTPPTKQPTKLQAHKPAPNGREYTASKKKIPCAPNEQTRPCARRIPTRQQARPHHRQRRPQGRPIPIRDSRRNETRPQAAYTIGHYLKNGAPPSPASAQSCAKSSSKQEKTPKCSLGCKASASPNTSPTNNGTRPSDKSSSGAPTRQVVMREDAQCSPRNRSCLLSFSYSLLHHILKDCDGTYQRY